MAPRVGYSGTRTVLDAGVAGGRYTARFVDGSDLDAVGEAVIGADLLWVETPTNPLLDTVDLEAVTGAARGAGALVAVDATFASPLRLRPLELGADLSMHSATKIMSGHSDLLMGVVSTANPELHQRLAVIRTRTGGVAGPMETWLALRGLRTLAVRLDRAESSARRLAEQLADHTAVVRVRYPGFGAMVAVEVGDAATADSVVDAVRLWVPATSLGGVESRLGAPSALAGRVPRRSRRPAPAQRRRRVPRGPVVRPGGRTGAEPHRTRRRRVTRRQRPPRLGTVLRSA